MKQRDGVKACHDSRSTSPNLHPLSQKAECAKNRGSCRGGSSRKLVGHSDYLPRVAEMKEVQEDNHQALDFYLRAETWFICTLGFRM